MLARFQRFALLLALGALTPAPAFAQKIGSFVDGERPMYIELDQLVGGQPFNLELRNVPADVTKVVLVYSTQFQPVDLTPQGIPGYLGPSLAGGNIVSLGNQTFAAGIAPGFTLGPVHIPLNPDPYFALTVGSPGLISFVGSATLDCSGRAAAQLRIPAFPFSPEITAHHAFVVLGRGGGIDFASNAASLRLVR